MNHQLPEEFQWVNRLKKESHGPVLRPQGRWAADCVFNPAAAVKDGRVGLLCRCMNLADRPGGERNWAVSSLVWSWSDDGVHFVTDEKPFLYPDSDSPYPGGFEDPRLVWIPEEKLWILTYTGVRAPTAEGTPGLLAWSPDLTHWEFGGEAFPARAVAIVNHRIGGRYWAYYGNSQLFAAWSEDLRHWHTENKAVLSPRADRFDSVLCEAAAPPVVGESGILLLYNGACTPEQRKAYIDRAGLTGYRYESREYMYSIGWALFDRNDPEKLLARADEPFLMPQEPFECFGLTDYTLFASGLAHFRSKYHLYYGCCDTRIGVAVEE